MRSVGLMRRGRVPRIRRALAGACAAGTLLAGLMFTGVGSLPAKAADEPREVWVDPHYGSENADGHTWGVDAFSTIQEGVNHVAAGGTVHVAPGTYNEQVTIDKSLTLQGADAETTIVQAPATLTADADGDRNVVTVRGTGVQVEVSGFTVRGPGPGTCGSLHAGLMVKDGAEANVHDNRFQDIRDNPLSGCQNGWGVVVGGNPNGTPGSATATIANNTFAGFQKGGIVVAGSGTSATVEGNTVTGAGNSQGVIGQDGILVTQGATATIRNNEVSGMRSATWQGTGIFLWDGVTGAEVAGNTVTGNATGIFVAGRIWSRSTGATTGTRITGNTIQGNSTGIAVVDDTSNTTISGNTIADNGDDGIRLAHTEPGLSAPTGVTIEDNVIENNAWNAGTAGIHVIDAAAHNSAHENRITGNTTEGQGDFGVHNESSDAFDATNNWWGDASGPNHSTFNPSATGDAVSDGVNFTPWLDAPGGTPRDHNVTVGDQKFNSIQEAIAAAQPGATVVVAPGTYNEKIIIAKSLTLRGDPQAPSGVVIEAAAANDAVVTLAADNVVFEGFTVRNTGNAAVQTSAAHSGYQIRNNVFEQSVFGLYLHSEGTQPTVVSGNLFDQNNRPGSASGDGIYSDHGLVNARIEGNRFEGHTSAAIVLAGNGARQVTIEGNQLDNSIAIFNSSDLTIRGNVRTAATAAQGAGSGIYIGGGVSDVTIEGNTLHDASNGIFIDNVIDAVNRNIAIHENSVSGSQRNGLIVKSGAYDGVVDATNNWWGDASGPEHTSNPGGTGDAVSDNVTFAPWITGLDVDVVTGGIGVPVGEATIVSPVVRTSDPTVTLKPADLAPHGLSVQYRTSGQETWTEVEPDGRIALKRFAPGALSLEVQVVNGAGATLLQSNPVTLTWVGVTPPPVVLGSTTETVAADETTTLTSPDGKLSLTVPAGTMPDGATVTVAPVAQGEEPGPGAGMVMIAGQVYEVVAEDPDGNALHSFGRPLHLSFTVDAANLPAGTSVEELQIFYWDDTLKVWVPVPSTVDPATGTVSADVDHLTVFAVAAAAGATTRVPPDVARHWAADEILKLVALGAVSGYQDGTFHPDANVTRAEFAKMLVGALKLGLPSAAEAEAQLASFADAGSIPDWAKPYVAAAVQAGYVTGYDDGTFRPGALVTRAQVAVMVARVLGAGAPQASLAFRDAGAIPDWAKAGVAAAVKAGIVTGYGDGTFRPAGNATRAEVAAMIVRLLEWRAAH